MTVKGCDKIAVLGHGGVEELGSHAELLAKKGLYHELWEKQGAASDDDDDNNDENEKNGKGWKGSMTMKEKVSEGVRMTLSI